MPAFVKASLGLVALALLASAAPADFKVAEVQPRLSGSSLTLAGSLDLGLTPKVEEALAKGIQLDVVIDLRLLRKRWWMWDQRAGNWSLRRSIRYHALSGQYLVNATGPESSDSYLSLQEALQALGSLNELRLALPRDPAEGDYVLDVRASLDIEALPAPLRPVAYTSLSWHLNSGWSTWKVAP